MSFILVPSQLFSSTLFDPIYNHVHFNLLQLSESHFLRTKVMERMTGNRTPPLAAGHSAEHISRSDSKEGSKQYKDNLTSGRGFENKDFKKVNPAPVKKASDANSLLGMDTVLLIICSTSRPEYLKRTLENVLKFHPR